MSMLRLAALGAIWGLSFILQRIAVPLFGPVATATGRVVLGAAVLIALAMSQRTVLDWRRNAGFYLVVGLANTAVPFSLFAWAAKSVPSAYLATMNALAPLFTALFAWALLGEVLSLQRLLAFGLGLVGVAVLVGLGPAPANAAVVAGVAAAISAAVCYGFAAIHVRRFGTGTTPLAVATGSSVAAALALLPWLALDLLRHPPAALDAPVGKVVQAAFAVILLGVLCTGLAYAIFYRLLADEGASRAVTVTFLVPMMSTAWAVVLLHERVTWASVAGIVLVLLGTALALGFVPLRARPAPA
jgi:drug/metabolite transporter (DMT)-like permease